jgi:hypothetical protein
MALPPVSDDVILRTPEAMAACGGNQTAAADMLGISRAAVQDHIRKAPKRGLVAPDNAVPVMEGFEVTRVQTGPRGTAIASRASRRSSDHMVQHYGREVALRTLAKDRTRIGNRFQFVGNRSLKNPAK